MISSFPFHTKIQTDRRILRIHAMKSPLLSFQTCCKPTRKLPTCLRMKFVCRFFNDLFLTFWSLRGHFLSFSTKPPLESVLIEYNIVLLLKVFEKPFIYIRFNNILRKYGLLLPISLPLVDLDVILRLFRFYLFII